MIYFCHLSWPVWSVFSQASDDTLHFWSYILGSSNIIDVHICQTVSSFFSISLILFTRHHLCLKCQILLFKRTCLDLCGVKRKCFLPDERTVWSRWSCTVEMSQLNTSSASGKTEHTPDHLLCVFLFVSARGSVLGSVWESKGGKWSLV